VGLLDLFKKKEAPKSAPRPVLRPGPARARSVRVPIRGREQLRHRDPRLVPLRHVHGGRAEDDPEAREAEKRYSYASWTAPSHYNLLTGPPAAHDAAERVRLRLLQGGLLQLQPAPRSEGHRVREDGPGLWLPGFLRNTLGYATHARVSLPVLNPRTGVNRDFDSFQLMEKHNDMRAMLPTIPWTEERPSFVLLNVGETHYPYAKPDEDSSMWPRISGVNGVFKKLEGQIDAEGNLVQGSEVPQFFDQAKLEELRRRQVETVRYLDGVFEELYDLVPKNTYLIVTSDHGELFGEGGYFGHGPIMHEKCFEVPYLEGKIR
jgi:hypothetical protein